MVRITYACGHSTNDIPDQVRVIPAHKRLKEINDRMCRIYCDGPSLEAKIAPISKTYFDAKREIEAGELKDLKRKKKKRMLVAPSSNEDDDMRIKELEAEVSRLTQEHEDTVDRMRKEFNDYWDIRSELGKDITNRRTASSEIDEDVPRNIGQRPPLR